MMGKTMARLPLIDTETLTGKLGEAMAALPVKLNIFRMLAHAETCAIPVMRLGGSILGRQQLGAISRELLILQAAKLERGEYEWVQHCPIALGVGVTQAQIDALDRQDFTADVFDAPTIALLAFGREVVLNVRVPPEVFAAAQQHFSSQEIVEAVITIGFYMMMARLTEATETDMDPAAGMAVYDNTQKRPRSA
jgi:alkylhydroperoxidase family enzyme